MNYDPCLKTILERKVPYSSLKELHLKTKDLTQEERARAKEKAAAEWEKEFPLREEKE